MPPEQEQTQEPQPEEAPPEASAAPEEAPEPYPIRDPGEDPRWAVLTVKIWVWFALASLAFVLTLLILGIFYD